VPALIAQALAQSLNMGAGIAVAHAGIGGAESVGGGGNREEGDGIAIGGALSMG
jgi:hypothetical protein